MIFRQTTLIEELLDCQRMTDCKPDDTPMSPYAQVSENEMLNEDNYNSYRSIVRCLLYLVVKFRPGIAVAASTLGSLVSKPERRNSLVAEMVLGYVKSTLNFLLVLKP